MRHKLKKISFICGIVLLIIGTIMNMRAISNFKPDLISMLLFIGGVYLVYKPLLKAKHDRKKFTIPKDYKQQYPRPDSD